jgi:hypothetical protein
MIYKMMSTNEFATCKRGLLATGQEKEVAEFSDLSLHANILNEILY